LLGALGVWEKVTLWRQGKDEDMGLNFLRDKDKVLRKVYKFMKNFSLFPFLFMAHC